MKANEIKAALQERGLTYSMIADATGVKIAHISAIINRHNKSMKVANIVAKAIEQPVERVFPEHFTVINQRKKDQEHRQLVIDDLRQRLAS
ncbi:DNA-binding protein [Shewanella sp. GutCb]|uniref:helix-turn-helix domain-containing protein n=1 Tax=Shewanella sp. GutCb TaxID=2058315 RepID=UPI000C7E5F34|nr:helix-turn-helix domain-containing protein [Shewanella sp. GutCb]PKG73155.1 DNA-binding protein [Shewanella sp. GutCb]